jgi:hypothetical protein
MLVHGDPQYEQSLTWTMDRLRRLAEKTDPQSPDDLRRLLIQAGQLEQALADLIGSAGNGLMVHAMTLSDRVAMACIELWKGGDCRQTFAGILQTLSEIQLSGDPTLTIRIPEGFEFYALFPEQYYLTAQGWIREHANYQGEVLVVGIRSIGTTLSAVVWATLVGEGWKATRMTVRPTGDPFARTTEIPEHGTRPDLAIIVDEGPGLSGSSMAAVADALHNRGLPRNVISFFPGNDNLPGRHASEHVQQWWAGTRRYFTGLESVRWNDKPLVAVLAEEAHKLLNGAVIRTDDLSAGLWRAEVFADESEWPAAPKQFEKAKYRQMTRDGTGLLWKFIGFGCMDVEPPIMEQIAARALLGWTRAPVAQCRGFLAVPWINGRPLTRSDCDDHLLGQLAAYIVDAAGTPLTHDESETALQRAFQILNVNMKHGWDPGNAEALPRPSDIAGVPCYGDGRMAPYEWLLTAEERVIKAGAFPHTRDHTFVGRQPLLWDVAGVIVEWDLSFPQLEHFLNALTSRGCEVNRELLNFYLPCYAAFRLGLMTLAAESDADAEGPRLRRAAEYYCEFLTNFLAVAHE